MDQKQMIEGKRYINSNYQVLVGLHGVQNKKDLLKLYVELSQIRLRLQKGVSNSKWKWILQAYFTVEGIDETKITITQCLGQFET